MILADKIISLRKKNGWSQEELAHKMNVSRQAVSKWEGAQTIPDIEKILQLGELFGVTTDYLLKDELEEEEYTGDVTESSGKRVTLAEANEYLEWRKKASVLIAVATYLCILSVIPLFILGAASEEPAYGISERLAGVIGMCILFGLAAIAIAIFLLCEMRNVPYAFLEKEPFETEYGVLGMVKERQKKYRNTYIKSNIIGTCLCVISPAALFVGALMEKVFFMVIMLTVTMAIAGIGAMFFIIAGVRWASMQKLLKEGEYTDAEKKKSKGKGAIALVYWLITTAIYLVWLFIDTGAQKWNSLSWIVWPIAGVLFAGVMAVCNIWMDRKEKSDMK